MNFKWEKEIVIDMMCKNDKRLLFHYMPKETKLKRKMNRFIDKIGDLRDSSLLFLSFVYRLILPKWTSTMRVKDSSC